LSELIDTQVYETGKASGPEDAAGEDALLSRIPLQSGDSRKAKYLSWRATGFSVREACALTPCDFSTLLRWRRDDAEFKDFEDNWLRELQKNVSRDLIHLEFMRNMRLALHRDFKVLFKAAYDLDSLSAREMDILKIIRRLYTPTDLLALEKSIEPDDGDRRGSTTVNQLNIIVDGQAVQSEEARRAAARELLDQFMVVTQKVQELPEGDNHDNGDSGDGDSD